MQARASGILLPVFSLPGPYGIGTLGAPARSFIDFLAQAGQKFWQILPLVPPGGGDSPYMSPSSFAGNPFFLDLEELTREGLLTQKELDAARRADPDRVDYAWLHQTRIHLLRRAWERGRCATPSHWRNLWRRRQTGCLTTPCSSPCVSALVARS